jgi:glutamyl-tRNA reductase
MTIVNLGLSHRSAPVGVLGRLALPSAELPDVLAGLHALPAVDEVAVLSTCNRIEVYAATRGAVGSVTRAAAHLLAVRSGFRAGEILRLARVHVDRVAVEHLFEVACGLDSMAVGEDQIVAQLKAAARAADEADAIGPLLIGLIDAALRVSKRARTQTAISTAGISLVRAGLDLAAAQLGGLTARRAVVLGTGSTGRRAARLLHEAGVERLLVAGRNEPGAAELAETAQGSPLSAGDVPAALADAHLLVAATGSLVPLVLADQVEATRERAGSGPQRTAARRTAATVYRIIRKFLHGPTIRAKQLAADPDGAVYLEALRQLFAPGPSEAQA